MNNILFLDIIKTVLLIVYWLIIKQFKKISEKLSRPLTVQIVSSLWDLVLIRTSHCIINNYIQIHDFTCTIAIYGDIQGRKSLQLKYQLAHRTSYDNFIRILL